MSHKGHAYLNYTNLGEANPIVLDGELDAVALWEKAQHGLWRMDLLDLGCGCDQ